jgi:hypothetical protein
MSAKYPITPAKLDYENSRFVGALLREHALAGTLPPGFTADTMADRLEQLGHAVAALHVRTLAR